MTPKKKVTPMSNLFEFKTSKGDVLKVPYLMDSLSYKKSRELNKKYGNDLDELGDQMMRAALTEEDYDTVADLPLSEFNRFAEEWKNPDGGDTTGE